MLCHLLDSFRAVIGERTVSSQKHIIPKPILRWLVLQAPFTWAKNLPTRPEVAQDAKGTPPGNFETDRAALLAAIKRFRFAPDARRSPHPVMGELSHEEWMRWGYLHVDHHLRQFGA
jgi:hypothetical protein